MNFDMSQPLDVSRTFACWQILIYNKLPMSHPPWVVRRAPSAFSSLRSRPTFSTQTLTRISRAVLTTHHFDQVYPNKRGNQETYPVNVTKDIWIERTDFREADEPGYYGLAPGKTVMLR